MQRSVANKLSHLECQLAWDFSRERIDRPATIIIEEDGHDRISRGDSIELEAVERQSK